MTGYMNGAAAQCPRAASAPRGADVAHAAMTAITPLHLAGQSNRERDRLRRDAVVGVSDKLFEYDTGQEAAESVGRTEDW